MEIILKVHGYGEVHIQKFLKLPTSHSTQCYQFYQMELSIHSHIILLKMLCEFHIYNKH